MSGYKKIFLLLTIFSVTWAGDTNPQDIKWGWLVIGLFGGLSLFLYGMNKMSEGMKKAAGNKMRSVLSALTKNRVIGVFVGAFVTMVIQSSSATTVMLVSFVQAKLMTYAQTIGIILGANIGTTVTAQLIAFKLTDYALLMIAIGFTTTLIAKKQSTKHIGEALLGFGILFFGMKLMGDAMKPLRTFEPFINMMKGLENPLMGLLIGMIFTALIQSSSAFTGIVIVLAQQGLITIDAGIPLILGANIGTCVTAGLASIGASREAKRVSIAHVLFNIGGVVLFIFWIPYFVELVKSISPVAAGEGIDKLAGEVPRQIANAHTIFNISVAVVFIPFTQVLAKYVYKILPEKQAEKGVVPVTWHLDESQIKTPAVAINLAQTEMSRMAKILRRMLKAIITPFVKSEVASDEIYPHLSLLEGLDMREDKIDYLEEKVTSYLFKISRQEMNDDQASEVFAMMSIVKDMECIGDIIHRDILPLIEKKESVKGDFSEQGRLEIEAYHTKVSKQMSRISEAFGELDLEKAQNVIRKEKKYRNLRDQFKLSHIKRVQKELEESIETHEIHIDLIDLLKQISVYLKDIANTIIEIKKRK
jgi:phosphate:Na+ symporter